MRKVAIISGWCAAALVMGCGGPHEFDETNTVDSHGGLGAGTSSVPPEAPAATLSSSTGQASSSRIVTLQVNWDDRVTETATLEFITQPGCWMLEPQTTPSTPAPGTTTPPPEASPDARLSSFATFERVNCDSVSSDSSCGSFVPEQAVGVTHDVVGLWQDWGLGRRLARFGADGTVTLAAPPPGPGAEENPVAKGRYTIAEQQP